MNGYDCFERFQARFTVKYRHCDGWLVLKITDNKSVSCENGLFHSLPHVDAVYFIFHSVSSIEQTSFKT